MADRKYSSRNIRKLIKLGAGSLALTLPVELVKKLKWKETQKLTVKLKGSKLVISDWKQKKR